MTNQEIKTLKDTLWQSADTLRADSGLKSSEYATPILGIIFLRFAESKYKQYEHEIKKEYDKCKGTRTEKAIHEIAIAKCGFYLPDDAKYEYLLNLPETENIPQKVISAMENIEKYTKELENTLPKEEYYAVDGKDGKNVLKKLLKAFKDIPENVTIDIFGDIYEFFLGKFALAEGQGGGEFFTPSTVVRYMVEVLNPTEGEIFDPACGSGGMFVQTAHYIQKHKAQGKELNLRAYGVEKTGATVKLAKMNLALNNIRGTITEANSYYKDPYNCFERFDYVMANPPFNVDGVELDDVKSQERFNTYGVPQNKSKTKKNTTETVPNGNYLWINMFATALKKGTGKAALVMANSASDAGNSEKEIRTKLIESGVISQMLTLPSNMFNSVTLPATIWFFEAQKKNKDEILFVDARNVFTQIDRAHRNFSDEQIKNLAIISRLYEGKKEDFESLCNEYTVNALKNIPAITENIKLLLEYKFFFDGDGKEEYKKPILKSLGDDYFQVFNKQTQYLEDITIEQIMHLFSDLKALSESIKKASIWLHQDKQYSVSQGDLIKDYDGIIAILNELQRDSIYFTENLLWLIERFPNSEYQDITGLCKVAKINGEDGIKDQDYSLNPGRYVGVVIEDDGLTEEEFKAEMLNLNTELTTLNTEAQELENTITKNLKELVMANE